MINKANKLIHKNILDLQENHMLDNDYLFEDFLKNIKELVNKQQSNNTNQKENFNPNNFLLNRNCTLYKRFFQESINLSTNQTISFFLKHIKDAIHLIALGNPSQDQINYFLVIISLFRNSIDFYTEKNDILNEKQQLILIEIGSEILKSESCDKTIKKNFLQLISSSSRKSPSQVVTFIYELDKYVQQQTPPKSIEWLFKMISSSISDIEALEIMISNIHTIEDANPQYYPYIMNLIKKSFQQIIIDNPESYTNFYNEGKDNQNVIYLDKKIDSWGVFEDLLPIKTVIYLLQPSRLNVSIFEGSNLYRTFILLNNTQEELVIKILDAIKIIYDTFLRTNVKGSMNAFLSKINHIVLDYYIDNHSNLCKPLFDFFGTVFPSCLLFLSTNLFENSYLPIMEKEEDYIQKFNQIINTIGPFIRQNKQEFYPVYMQLFKPINELIQKNDKEISSILQTIKHFPFLFQFFIYENTFTFHKMIENGMTINYYDLFYSEYFYSMPVEPPFWTITKYISDLMIKIMEKNFANYSPSQKVITTEFSRFYINIISFIQIVILNQNCEYSKNELISILHSFEAIAYSTLSTNRKADKANCKSILASIYTIIQKLKFNIDICGENIFSFGTVCNANHNACQEFAKIYKNYLINTNDDIHSKLPIGWELTILILMPRFDKITRFLLNKWPNQQAQSSPSDQKENNQNDNQIQQLQESQDQQFQDQDTPQKAIASSQALEELKSCIYVLFPLIKESSSRFEELIYLILENNGQIGNECTSVIANALSPTIYYNILQLIDSNFTKMVKKINELNKSQIGFVENSINLIIILLDNQLWVPNSNYSTIFTNIVNNTSILCAQFKMQSLDNLFCKFIILLFELTGRVDFEIKIDSKVRNSAGKMIIGLINLLQSPEKDKSFELYYLALYSILDGINFQECKIGEVLSQNYVPFEIFLFYYSQRIISETLITISTTTNTRKTSLLLNNGSKIINCDYCLQQNQRNRNQSTLSILNPILKNNFDLCINHTISLAFDPKTKVRTSFLNALSSALTPETYQQFVNPTIDRTVADLIFENDLEILKLLANESPYKSGEIAEAVVKASALKKIEMKVFEEMAKIEIKNNKDPTRNTLFRGNGLTSRVISYFPKYFANKWANDLIHPLLSLDTSNLKMFWSALILRIEEMFTSMPARMKQAIRILFNLLAPESTEIAFSMLSGFLFLRFLCPLLAKVEDLVKTSSLLMTASVRPNLSESKSQFNYLKTEVADAYKRIRNLFQKIVCFDLYCQNGQNYKPTPIELKPLEPPLDSESITSDLIAALWTQMSFIQKTFHQTSDDIPIHATLDQLIAKLKEAGNPHRKIEPISISEVLNFESMLNPPLIELLQTNQHQDPSLEKWFYLAPLISRDGSFIFMMNMSEIKQPFTAPQLCAYLFSQLLSIGDAKYSIFVEFADFDVELLPSLSQLKKTIKLATNDIVSRLVTVYVGRIQESATNYLYKASKLLKKLPLKVVTDMKMIRDEIGELRLSEATKEFFSTPEKSFQLQEKSNFPLIRLHQNSIQIIDKAEINQVEFLTSNVFLFSTIENIGPSQTSKSTSYFTIRMKNGKSYNIQSPASIKLRSVVSQLFRGYNEVKHEKKLCVDRSSFASLILIISFLNMFNENGDQELKASALNLYNTIIESSGLKTTVEKHYFSKDEVPFSMLQMVEMLARDLASSNPNEVHSFFLEFTKVISFLDYRDYANSERFLQPWLHIAAEKVINNQITLNCLAQISSKAPKKCFIEFNKGIWQNFNRIDLLDPLFDKLCDFDDSCFASIFLLIAVKYSNDVTRFFVEKLLDLATELTQRQFTLVAEILNSLIVSELFDYSYKETLLHELASIRLLGLSSLSKPCLMVLQAILKNSIDSNLFSCTQSLLNFINDDINNNSQSDYNKAKTDQRGDYRQFIYDTVQLSLLYREFYSKKLFDLFMSDTKGLLDSNSSSLLTDSNFQKGLIPKLNGIIFISALENDYSIAFELYKLFYNFNPFKTLSVCSMSLSLAINSIPSSFLPSLFFTSIASILYSNQTTSFELIYSILRIKNMNFNDIINKVQSNLVELFDSITNFSFTKQPLLSFLHIIIYFYGCGKIDIPNILCQKIFDEKKNSLEGLILLAFRFNFDESLEHELHLMINNCDEKVAINTVALIVIIYLWNPSEHIKRLLISLLEAHPNYFSNINFAYFYSRNSNQFKFVDTKLLILLAKTTSIVASNNQQDSEINDLLHPIIASVFSGDQISLITLDQTKSIFNSFFPP